MRTPVLLIAEGTVVFLTSPDARLRLTRPKEQAMSKRLFRWPAVGAFLLKRMGSVELAVILILTVSCGEFFRGSNDLVKLSIAPTDTTIVLAQTQQFSASGALANGQVEDITQQVTWTSSNSKIVTINSTGLATGIADGTVTISANSQGLAAHTSLTVVSQTAAINCSQQLHR
jgi:hypothetical protein